MATDSDSKIKCGQLNAQSLGKKQTYIHDFLKEKDLHILVMTETCPNDCNTAEVKEMIPVIFKKVLKTH